MQELLKKLKLQLLILQLQLRVKLLKEKLTIPTNKKPMYVVVHHGAGSWGFFQINESHKQKWGFKSSLGYYIGYHKFISYNGVVHIARQDTEEGAHCVEIGNPNFWNRNSVGICLQGNFEEEEPTPNQLIALRKELEFYKLPVKMHCQIIATLCPGNNLKKWLIKEGYVLSS